MQHNILIMQNIIKSLLMVMLKLNISISIRLKNEQFFLKAKFMTTQELSQQIIKDCSRNGQVNYIFKQFWRY